MFSDHNHYYIFGKWINIFYLTVIFHAPFAKLFQIIKYYTDERFCSLFNCQQLLVI